MIMEIVKIILGLVGLVIVVFIHELGHFLAARFVGIDVEAFSIGWGPPILKKNIGSVEYRLGVFPLGGYCKMRGDNEFQEAWEKHTSGVEPVKGTFYGASPWRRIVVCLAGPVFNLVFAVIVLSIIWGIGFERQTLENRIILASEINAGNVFPADTAGFQTGDRIVEINGKETNYYHEVQEAIAVNPERLLTVTVERQGEIMNLFVTPDLDRSTGMGRIGVYFWADPVIADISPDSDAAIAGLLPGDRIINVNNDAINHIMDFDKTLDENSVVTIHYIRDGAERSARLENSQGDWSGLGIRWSTVQYRTPALSPPAALVKGVSEGWKTFVTYLKGLSLLFRGIDLTQAVSGPLRITYMMGDVAAVGFGENIGTGLRSMAHFLSFISVALFVMNLLPIPLFDGGQIILFIVEILRRKPLPPRAIGVFQTVGIVLVAGLLIFALFGDILYFVSR